MSRPQLKPLMTVMLLGVSGIVLSACATTNQNFATLQRGACVAFPRAPYQVKGQTSFDQRWADETIEAEVVGCGFKRPQARPATLMPVKVVKPSPKATFKRKWLGRFFRNRAEQNG